MVLVIKSGGEGAMPEWRAHFNELLPDLDVYSWNDPDLDPKRVEYAMVWEPTPGRLAQFPALRVIMSSAAGVDHITRDKTIPRHLPIARMVTPETAERMADFVTAATYGIIRKFVTLREAQSAGRWDESIIGDRASETTVTLLGLGNLGTASAMRLVANGFKVRGWSRTHKTVPGVATFAGQAELIASIDGAKVVINLLPDTAATHNLINASLLDRLPRGASLINVGRAAQVDIDAVCQRLNTEQLHSVFLDVFDPEPLPESSPLWRHPKVWVSSHIASSVSQRSKAQQVVKNILADQNGLPLEHLYHSDRGY